LSLSFSAIPVTTLVYIDVIYGNEILGIWGNIARLFCTPIVLIISIISPFLSASYLSHSQSEINLDYLAKSALSIIFITTLLLPVIFFFGANFFEALNVKSVLSNTLIALIFLINIINLFITNLIPFFQITKNSKFAIYISILFLILLLITFFRFLDFYSFVINILIILTLNLICFAYIIYKSAKASI